MLASVVVMVLLAACAGGDDDAESGSTAASEVSATSTTVAAVDSTSTTSTSPASTTTASTTSTSTMLATTTTEPEPSLEDLEAEVAAAYQDRYDGYWACLRAPLNCDTSWLAPGSGSEQAMFDTMQGLADRDRFVGDDDVGYFVIESIEFNDDLTEATVVTCWWSTAVLYTGPADPSRPVGPDNPATIVNNTPGSSTQSDVLVPSEAGWVIRQSRGLEAFPEENQCGT